MYQIRSLVRLVAALLLSVSMAACVADSPGDELSVTCNGKCDGFDSIKSLIADAKKLDLEDLISVGASYATEELNNLLDVTDYAKLELDPTELYALPDVVAEDLTLNDINKLVSGLSRRFGDKALTTEVNAIRAEHLSDPAFDDIVFAESAFSISAAFNHSWNLFSKGLGDDMTLTVNLGFSAGADLEARVISAFDSELVAAWRSPLAAIKSSRGFVLPRSVGDIRGMRPGESFALKGSGRLGINLGVGIPIVIAEPLSFLTYRIVLSAGLRTMLEGELDVQLVRMRGDEIVIDVGMQTSNVKSARIGIHDSWGVSGLLDLEVEFSGISVDLGRLVEKALQNRLNKHLNLIRAELSHTKRKTRISVARLRFSLDADDPEGAREQALAQALRGDVRLAQALSNRGDSGVVTEFDLLRSGVSAASYAGIEILGMHFFTKTEASEGSVVQQTPGGTRTLLFESLHREGGWFFSSHGYTRVGLAGLVFDGPSRTTTGETNLFIQLQEGDKFMERDKVIDHLDGVILALAGPNALTALERHGNDLERYILERCPLPESNDTEHEQPNPFSEGCNIDLIRNDAQVASLRAAGISALQGESSHLAPSLRELVMKAGELRMAAQSLEDPEDLAAGPTASIVLDYRLDDAALTALMNRDGIELENAVIEYMKAAQLLRTRADVSSQRDNIAENAAPAAAEMRELFDRYSDRYQSLAAIEKAEIEGLGQIGANAIEIRFEIDQNKRPLYEQATSRSLAQARSKVALEMFDELLDAADEIPFSGGASPHPEQTVGYSLLALTAHEQIDLRVDFDTDNSSCFICLDRDRYDEAGFVSFDQYARGDAVSPINGGLFDIDALIDLR